MSARSPFVGHSFRSGCSLPAFNWGTRYWCLVSPISYRRSQNPIPRGALHRANAQAAHPLPRLQSLRADGRGGCRVPPRCTQLDERSSGESGRCSKHIGVPPSHAGSGKLVRKREAIRLSVKDGHVPHAAACGIVEDSDVSRGPIGSWATIMSKRETSFCLNPSTFDRLSIDLHEVPECCAWT